MTPLGVRTIPHDPLPKTAQLSAVLPKNAVVRLDTKSWLAEDGEEIVVYDSGSEFSSRPHLAIVRGGQRAADFSIAKAIPHSGCEDICPLIASAEFELGDGKRAFLVAFCTSGDGSAISFAILAEYNRTYRFIWSHQTNQGQIRIFGDGRLEVWDSEADGECVWCPQHYEVTTLAWSGGKMKQLSSYKTKHALDPDRISNEPIVFPKSSHPIPPGRTDSD
jgi:hypothetical protein